MTITHTAFDPSYLLTVELSSTVDQPSLHADAIKALASVAHVERDFGMQAMSPLPAPADALGREGAEHVFLLAVSVTAPSRARGEEWLHFVGFRPNGAYAADGTHVDSWWMAEDDRRDGSDCSSAVFIPGDFGYGMKQRDARWLLEHYTGPNMAALDVLRRGWETWADDRASLSMLEDAGEADSDDWAASDDAGCDLLDQLAEVLWSDAFLPSPDPVTPEALALTELRDAVARIGSAWDGRNLADIDAAVRDALELMPAEDATEDDAEEDEEDAEYLPTVVEHYDGPDAPRCPACGLYPDPHRATCLTCLAGTVAPVVVEEGQDPALLLRWESAGHDDEPRDQNADNPCGPGFYEVGPNTPGWSAVLTGSAEWPDVNLSMHEPTEEAAKDLCQRHANGEDVAP